MKKNLTNKNNYLVLSYKNFTVDRWINLLIENFNLNTTYSLLIKLSFEDDSLFFMAGSQIGFVVKDNHNIDYYKRIYQIISDRIEDFVLLYDVEGYPDNLNIILKRIKGKPELILKDITSISLDQNIKNKTELRKVFSSKYLPLSNDNSYFGRLLEGPLRDKYVTDLISKLRALELTIPEYLVTDMINSTKIFLFKKSSTNLLIIDRRVTDLNLLRMERLIHFNQFTVLNNAIENKNINVRSVYDIETGVKIFEAIDIVHSDYFTRTNKNTTLTIYNE